MDQAKNYGDLFQRMVEISSGKCNLDVEQRLMAFCKVNTLHAAYLAVRRIGRENERAIAQAPEGHAVNASPGRHIMARGVDPETESRRALLIDSETAFHCNPQGVEYCLGRRPPGSALPAFLRMPSKREQGIHSRRFRRTCTRHHTASKGFTSCHAPGMRPANLRDPALDEITFGWYVPDDGTTGEMQMRWEHLAGAIVPHLIVFDDAWHALATFTDVHSGHGRARVGTISHPLSFVRCCKHHGFTDLTKVEMEA